MERLVLAGVFGYLLGNVQFAVILSKLLHNDDVRNYGSGNAGSTNMLRVYGLKAGLITFLGDLSKGVLAVFIGRWLAGENGAYLCALLTVIGHVFPIFLRFRGGKGVATAFAIIWALNPLYALVVTILVIILLVTTRIVAVASVLGVTAYLLQIMLFEMQNTKLLLLAFCLWLILIQRHKDNIARILKGEEKQISIGKKGKKE